LSQAGGAGWLCLRVNTGNEYPGARMQGGRNVDKSAQFLSAAPLPFFQYRVANPFLGFDILLRAPDFSHDARPARLGFLVQLFCSAYVHIPKEAL
jgi:hypothetical protein